MLPEAADDDVTTMISTCQMLERPTRCDACWETHLSGHTGGMKLKKKGGAYRRCIHEHMLCKPWTGVQLVVESGFIRQRRLLAIPG